MIYSREKAVFFGQDGQNCMFSIGVYLSHQTWLLQVLLLLVRSNSSCDSDLHPDAKRSRIIYLFVVREHLHRAALFRHVKMRAHHRRLYSNLH